MTLYITNRDGSKPCNNAILVRKGYVEDKNGDWVMSWLWSFDGY